jgi:hypothetical protein
MAGFCGVIGRSHAVSGKLQKQSRPKMEPVHRNSGQCLVSLKHVRLPCPLIKRFAAPVWSRTGAMKVTIIIFSLFWAKSVVGWGAGVHPVIGHLAELYLLDATV